MTPEDLFHEAKRCTHQARQLYDFYDGKNLPADAAGQIDVLLSKAGEFRRRAELDADESWLREPQYRHPMFDGKGAPAGGYSGGGYDSGPLSPATKSFLQYIRTGSQDYMTKANLVEDATGLNLVPHDYAGTILKALSREGVFRQLAFTKPTTKETVDIGSVSVGTPTWGRLEVTGGPPAEGLGATPAAKDSIVVHELSALAKIGVDELNDSDENLADIVRQALASKFAEVEDDAFASGNGTLKPFGIVSSTANPITQSVTAAVSATPTADDLKSLTFAVSARSRRRGAFVGHSLVEKAVSLLKDNDGRYLFQPSAAQGEPGTLFGYPWYSADGMPSPTTAGVTDASVVFGDIYAGYMIADRQRFTVQVLRELFAQEGKVGLLVKERVGGDVIRPASLAKYLL